MANGKKKGRGAVTYKSYLFIDKDPIIDALRTVVQDSGKNLNAVHEGSGVASSTLYNWFHGATRRPQFATVSAVALSLGKRHITFRAGVPKFE